MNTLLQRTALAAGVGVGGWLSLRAALRHQRRMDFLHRVVLITGGSRGLGLVIARQLADEGARIAICARDRDELDRAAKELSSRGAEVYAEVCDVTQPTSRA